MKGLSRNLLRKKRKRRVLVKGTAKVPRVSIFRSNSRVFVQLIDDGMAKSLGGFLAGTKEDKTKEAFKAGEKIGELAKKLKIERAVFDRGGYRFHGRVKAVMEGAESKGLKFKKQAPATSK